MSEDSKVIIIALIILTPILAGIQWLLLRFTHWSIALIISGLISCVISFLYVSLSNATPNGAGNSVNFSEYITPAILIFSIFICGFCLVCYLNKNQIPKMVYVVSLSLIPLMILGQIGLHFIEKYKIRSYYNEVYGSCQIEIKNETGNKPSIRRIYLESESCLCLTNIELKTNNDVNAILNQNDLNSIPRFANIIEFEYFSTKYGRLFIQEFPFDYSLCQENEEVGLHKKSDLLIKIVLKTDQKVDLYIDNRFIKQYLLNN